MIPDRKNDVIISIQFLGSNIYRCLNWKISFMITGTRGPLKLLGICNTFIQYTIVRYSC